MKAIGNQFWIVLQGIARLFWLIAKELSILVYRLAKWLYAHRRQIATHKATPWALATLAAVWSVWQMYGHVHSSSVAVAPPANTVSSPISNSSEEAFKKDYFLLTGMHPSSKASHTLTSRVHSWLNVPHQDGGKSRAGTDCSGFVQNVYKEAFGITLSRSSAQMYEQDVTDIAKEELTEGDLVFFDTFGGNSISHVGIYLDNQRFAHSSTSRGVTIDSLTNPYYLKHYYASGRIKALSTEN